MPVVIWFFKTLHSKPVIFLVYALKETDGENHKGRGQQNTVSPPLQHSQWYHLMHSGPQIAFKWDQRFASGQTHPRHTATHSVTSAGTRSWKASTFGHCPPQPIAWVTLMPVVCSLLGGKCWLFCTLQSIQFCGHKTFCSRLTWYQKTFLLPQNYWTSAPKEHQGLAEGM